MQGINRKLSAHDQQNQLQHQHQPIQISQQQAPQHQQQIQVGQTQQINIQSQQFYTISPPKNVRVESQNSPCRIVNYQPIQQIQQIHKIPQQQYYLSSQLTPIRQRVTSQQITSNSLNSLSLQQAIPVHPPIQIPSQLTTSSTTPLQNQQQNQQSTPQNMQASSKPISQIPEKHRLLQQSSKNNTQNNSQQNQNQNNIVVGGGGQISTYLNNQQYPQQQQGYFQPQGVRNIQRSKHKSEMNLPQEYLQTPIQHMQTPQQMMNLNTMFNKNNMTSPPSGNISISQNLLPSSNKHEDQAGTPMNQNNGQASFFNENNASNSAGFHFMPTSSSNNMSLPQTAVKNVNQKNQSTSEREYSPYNNLQNQLSTNQKSPNMHSTNLGFSTQNSGQIPYVFSEEAAVGSINAGNSTSANRYVSKASGSPQRIPQFFIKQNYQFSNGNCFNSNTPNGNSSSFLQTSQTGIPQQTKSNQEVGRSSSCSDIRKRSQYKNVLQWDNQNNNNNNKTLNLSSNNDRNLDRSADRFTQGNDITIPKPNSTVNQSSSFIHMPRTPTRINPSSSSSNLQVSLLNSNSKKLRDLEEQIRDLVNENTKMSQLLEEKGYLLQQIQDEKLVQSLLVENSELKEQLKKALMENDLTIQNRVLHTENSNLNKILSEKVKEIRELKDMLQSNIQNAESQSQKKVVELERNIKLLISENEHLGDLLKQRQNEIQRLREDNNDSHNRIINLQSHIQELQDQLKSHDQTLSHLRNLEQQHRYLEKNTISNEKYNVLKNDFDQIQRQLAEKDEELIQFRYQNEKNTTKIEKDAEEQITKLVEENEKLNEIISQYVNSSNADLINSCAIGKVVPKTTIGREEEEKLQIFDSLQNCNKDYEDKINTLVAQTKNLEEVILDLEKDKQELAENLKFMEDRQKVIEKKNEDLQLQVESQGQEENGEKKYDSESNNEQAQHIQQLEMECQGLQEQLAKVSEELKIKYEELHQLSEQLEDSKIYFEQIIQEKLEQINRLNQQLQDQSNYIDALQQQQVQQIEQIEQGEDESRKKSSNQPQKRQQEGQLNQSNKSSRRSSQHSQNLQEEDENITEQQFNPTAAVSDITKYKEELKEKNDIIKNLCENLDFQKEQVNELNDKVQQQAILILQQEEQLKQYHNEIERQSEKFIELQSNIGDQKSLNRSQRKSKDNDSSIHIQSVPTELTQQLEYKDHLIQEHIVIIKDLEERVINLQKQLKEFKPDLQLDTSSVVNIQRLESQSLISPTLSTNSRYEKKQLQEEKVIHLQQYQVIENVEEVKQQQLVNPQQIQQIIDREIQSFDQKYKEKMNDLEKEMHTSLNEREEKIIELVNENQKLLQLNEQRLIELQILNQQIEMRKEQNIRDTKTIEELQKKIQMMLSKNIQFNKGISKNTSLFQQTSSERSLIDSIREEESEESQDIDGQKQQQQQVIQSHETKRLQRKLEEKRRQLQEVQQELETLKEKQLDFEEAEFRLTSENRQLQEDVRRLQQQSDDNNKLNEMLKTRKNEYNELKKRFEAIRAERDELVSKLKEIKSQEASPTNQQLKQSQINSFELFKEMDVIKKENNELKKVHDQFVVQIKKKEKEIAEKQEELDQVKNKCNELTDQLQTSHSAPQSFCVYQGQEEQVQKPNSANNL